MKQFPRLKNKFIASLILFALAIFWGIILRANNNLYSINLSISELVQSLDGPFFYDWNKLISYFDNAVWLLPLPLSIWLYFKNYKREAILIILAGVSFVIVRILKYTFALPCPPQILNQDLSFIRSMIDSSFLFHFAERLPFYTSRYCYPSGHVFDYVAFFGIIAHLRTIFTKNRSVQVLLLITPIVLILTIGSSRIYLGAHWFTDVVGGYLFGSAWLLFLLSI